MLGLNHKTSHQCTDILLLLSVFLVERSDIIGNVDLITEGMATKPHPPSGFALSLPENFVGFPQNIIPTVHSNVTLTTINPALAHRPEMFPVSRTQPHVMMSELNVMSIQTSQPQTHWGAAPGPLTATEHVQADNWTCCQMLIRRAQWSTRFSSKKKISPVCLRKRAVRHLWVHPRWASWTAPPSPRSPSLCHYCPPQRWVLGAHTHIHQFLSHLTNLAGPKSRNLLLLLSSHQINNLWKLFLWDAQIFNITELQSLMTSK